MASEIPFLGFGQPGKVYHLSSDKAVKTADGWKEYCRVPYGYGTDETGKPMLVDAVLTCDQQGRLVRFRRNRAGEFWENTQFSQFIKEGSLEIPGRVHYTETQETGGRVTVDAASEMVYQVRTLDAKPVPPEWFSVQRPPQGTNVQDSRFSPSPPGAAARAPEFYQYHGPGSLDAQSRARADRKGR